MSGAAQQAKPARKTPPARRKEGTCEPSVRDRAVHRAIAAEGAELRRRVALRLPPANPSDFPHVYALYLAALGHVRTSGGLPKWVTHRGRRYRVAVTNFGRIKVMDGAGQMLMAGALGAAW